LLAQLTIAALVVVTMSASSPAGSRHRHSAHTYVMVRSCIDWFKSRSRDDAPALRQVSGTLACYDGKLDDRHGADLADWLSKRSNPSLVIRSPGGSVAMGLRIGRAVFKSSATVKAFQVCASSCANYVFGASPRRVIMRDTLVVFHGGVSQRIIGRLEEEARSQLMSAHFPQETIDKSVRSIRRDLEEQLQEQRQLLTAAGVDPGFLERFDNVTDHDLATLRCTNHSNRDAIYLTKGQFLEIGMAVHGFTISTLQEAALILKKIKSTRGVCQAPSKLVRDR